MKNESANSQGKLSVSWRKQEKGREVQKTESADQEKAAYRIAGYVRLSPTGDEREEGSLVSHPQRIKEFVDYKNVQSGGTWGAIADWYIDKDLSGKDLNRPSFKRLCNDIQAGKIDLVIVTELSRLTRKVKDFCHVWEFFREHNVKLISLKENFDT
jgi:DNA invertase Pin-like site-specific DNA recombinase